MLYKVGTVGSLSSRRQHNKKSEITHSTTYYLLPTTRSSNIYIHIMMHLPTVDLATVVRFRYSTCSYLAIVIV
jgi:hypothetical protein